MMPYELAFLKRRCNECKNNVTQLVFYDIEEGRIKTSHFWKECPVCGTKRPKPSEGEIWENLFHWNNR
jgi:hypothetical protein